MEFGAAEEAAAPAAAEPMGTSAAIDVAALRADFPILSRRVNGAPLVYLDSAATSQKPVAVLDAMEAYYRETNANVHRGVYSWPPRRPSASRPGATRWPRLVSAPREGVVFTKNASEAINLVAWAWGVRDAGRRRRDPRDRDGAPLQHRPVADRGRDHRRRRCGSSRSPRTASSTWTPSATCSRSAPGWSPWSTPATSSARSTRSPRSPGSPTSRAPWCWWTARRASPTCRSTSRPWAATSSPSRATRCSARPGSACWSGRPALLEAMEPFLGGGEMISNVTTRGLDLERDPVEVRGRDPADRRGRRPGRRGRLPGRDRAWTPCGPTRWSWPTTCSPRSSEVEGITIYGPRDPEARGGAVSFSLPDIHPHDIAQLVDRRASASGPATTAPSRSCASWAWAPRPARAPTSTIRTMRSTCSCAPWAPRGPHSASGRIERAMGGLDDLYQELILDHYRRKRGEGTLDNPSRGRRPAQPALRGRDAPRARHRGRPAWSRSSTPGEGCSISQASVSMMSEALSGLSVDEALAPGGALPADDARRRGGRRGPAGRRHRPRGRGEVPGAREVRPPRVDGREGRDPDLPTQRRR